MSVVHRELAFETRGHHDVHDITAPVQDAVRAAGLSDGTVTVFVPGATGGVTTIEFEDGAVRDLESLFDEIVPPNATYAHNERWGDGNGHSHVRAALLGPDITVPVRDSNLLLGTWQQIFHLECDIKPRSRTIVVTVMGE